jgi:hypothetical protein
MKSLGKDPPRGKSKDESKAASADMHSTGKNEAYLF